MKQLTTYQIFYSPHRGMALGVGRFEIVGYGRVVVLSDGFVHFPTIFADVHKLRDLCHKSAAVSPLHEDPPSPRPSPIKGERVMVG